MAEVKTIKLGGHDVQCKIDNRMSNFSTKIGVPLVASTVRESWNKQRITLPNSAVSARLQLDIGSDIHREISLSVDIPINMFYNSASLFRIVEQLVEWSMNELKANRFISVNVIFEDKNGCEINIA